MKLNCMIDLMTVAADERLAEESLERIFVMMGGFSFEIG